MWASCELIPNPSSGILLCYNIHHYLVVIYIYIYPTSSAYIYPSSVLYITQFSKGLDSLLATNQYNHTWPNLYFHQSVLAPIQLK